MTKTKTVMILSDDKVANVAVNFSDFVSRTAQKASTTGFRIMTSGNVSVGKKTDSPPVGFRAIAVSSKPNSYASATGGLIFESSNAANLNVTLRPHVVEREANTQRLNKSLALGYTPPKQPTKSA
ncbi:MAG: hypothetical protein NTX56_07745 [Proteobacteria bacterium]|nr:hypothetical protein [Pseudomonadota bacterium]